VLNIQSDPSESISAKKEIFGDFLTA